jgi:hypothetical protein
MEADNLFLERCSQIERLMESNREIDLLDLAAILRQILLDGLVHKANSILRIRLTFRVGEFHYRPDKYTQILGLEEEVVPLPETGG